MKSEPRKIPFFDFCNIVRPFREGGRCLAQVDITSDLRNGFGTAHGGLLMTLLDACMAGAASSTLDPGHSVITIDMQVTFLSPGHGRLTGEGRVLRNGRSIIVVEGWIRDEKDELIAKATGLFRPLKASSPPLQGG